MFSVARSLFARKAFALIVVLSVAFVPFGAQAGGIDLPEDSEAPVISYANEDICARGQMPHPWIFIGRGHASWLFFSWTPDEPPCFLNLLAQTSDPAVFRFTRVEYTNDQVNCEGSTARRIVCTSPGDVGTVVVGIRYEAVSLGEETLSVYESSSGTARLYDMIVLPDFLSLAPFTVR